MPSGSIPHGHERPDAANRHAKKRPDYDYSYELKMAHEYAPPLVAVPFRAVVDPNIDDLTFRIYAGICAYTNMQNELWISHETLAHLLHIHLDELEGGINLLKIAGYLAAGDDADE